MSDEGCGGGVAMEIGVTRGVSPFVRVACVGVVKTRRGGRGWGKGRVGMNDKSSGVERNVVIADGDVVAWEAE